MCERKVRSCKQKIICTYILHSTVSSWLQKGHRNFVDKNKILDHENGHETDFYKAK